jgi:hypothetical protein
MLRGVGPFRPGVTRLGQFIGVGLLAGLVLVGIALPLPWMSWPQRSSPERAW